MKNHLYFAITKSGGSEELLLDALDAITLHYQNIHDNCRLTSPCIRNPRYFPSRVILTEPSAVEMISKWVKNTSIYKNPHLVLEGLATSHLESANGALRSFVPKKQTYGDENYKHRTNMFILDWNCNVSRPQHRVINPALAGTPRENSGRIVRGPKSYEYQRNLCRRYFDIVIQNN